MSIENVKTIQGIYEAFGKGDIAGIAARCAPDTVWGFAAAYPEQVPWHAEVRGVDALGPFFASMGESVAFETFAPREFVHCGPHVLVEVSMAYTVRATGRRVEMVQVHWWNLDGGGRVVRMTHYEDSAAVLRAVA